MTPKEAFRAALLAQAPTEQTPAPASPTVAPKTPAWDIPSPWASGSPSSVPPVAPVAPVETVQRAHAVNSDDPKGRVMQRPDGFRIRMLSDLGITKEQSAASRKQSGIVQGGRRQATQLRKIERRSGVAQVRQVSMTQQQRPPRTPPPNVVPVPRSTSRRVDDPYGQRVPMPALVGPQQWTALRVPVYAVAMTQDRPQLLPLQLQALAASTRVPTEFVLWVGAGSLPHNEAVLATVPKKHRAPDRLSPWQIMYAAAEARSELILLLEEDAVPGPRWLEAAVDFVGEQPSPCIVCVAGDILDEKGSIVQSYGPDQPNEHLALVDVGRGGWLMPRAFVEEIIGYARDPAWRMAISTIAQINDSDSPIPTFVLPYDTDRSTWGTTVPLAKATAIDVAPYRAMGWRPIVEHRAEQASAS